MLTIQYNSWPRKASANSLYFDKQPHRRGSVGWKTCMVVTISCVKSILDILLTEWKKGDSGPAH